MTELSTFLDRLFADGSVVFTAAPARAAETDVEAVTLLRAVHADALRTLAGPPLEFRPPVALAAAEFLRHACWFLVSRDEPADRVEGALVLPPPGDAAEHFSGDLTLRYLPHVERRARALAPDDLLSRRLAEVLATWPLSGVLADAAGPPRTTPAFDDHPGLLLLYAERFAAAEKPDWQPPGRGREFVEMIYNDRGRNASVK
jgi:hypothetical protein